MGEAKGEKGSVLVTAGSTIVPIDKVRSIIPFFQDLPPEASEGISNIFKGKTGSEIAIYFCSLGYKVTLINSNLILFNQLVRQFVQKGLDLSGVDSEDVKNQIITEAAKQVISLIRLTPYRTYQELLETMEYELTHNQFDIVIHSSAVADYYVDQILAEEEIAPDSGTHTRLLPIPKDGKVKSDYDCLHLVMRKTQKLIDLIRSPWGFKGTLVKFKLEVGKTDDELLTIAHNSAKHSKADFIVANCLEWATVRAFIIRTSEGTSTSFGVTRDDLPTALELQLRS